MNRLYERGEKVLYVLCRHNWAPSVRNLVGWRIARNKVCRRIAKGLKNER